MIGYCLGMFAALGWQYPETKLPDAQPLVFGDRLNLSLNGLDVTPTEIPSGVSYQPDYRVIVNTRQGKVTLKRPRESGFIRVLFKGSDGTFLYSYGGSEGALTYTVLDGKLSKAVNLPKSDSVKILEYRDRSNFAGTMVKSIGPKGERWSPYQLFEFRHGVFRDLGWGEFVFRLENGIIVSRVPVSRDGSPADMNSEEYDEIWLTKGTRQTRFARGTIVGRSGPNSFMFQDNACVYRYKNGRIDFAIMKPSGGYTCKAKFSNQYGDFFLEHIIDQQTLETDTYLFRRGQYHPVDFSEITDGRLPYSITWSSGKSMLVQKRYGSDSPYFEASLK